MTQAHRPTGALHERNARWAQEHGNPYYKGYLNPYDPVDVYEKAKRLGLGSPQPKTAVGKFFERGSQAGAEMATMVDNKYKTSTGNQIADFGADVLGSMAGIVANPGGAGLSAGGSILRGAEQLTEKGLGKFAPKLPGISQGMAREGMGSLAYEGTKALSNEREFSGREAATAFLGDALLAGGLGVVGKGLGKELDIKTGKIKMDDDINYDALFDEVIRRNSGDIPPVAAAAAAPDGRYDSSVLDRRGQPPLLLPESATTPNFELSSPERAADVIGAKRARLEQPVPNRNVDPGSLPDQYPLPDVSPETIAAKALVNRAKSEHLMLPGEGQKHCLILILLTGSLEAARLILNTR